MREGRRKRGEREPENDVGGEARRADGRKGREAKREREGERHAGEPSTQARSTWPTHIAPTRFLSLADNCTISLHSLVLSSLPSHRPLRVRSLLQPSFPRRSEVSLSLSHLPSSSSTLRFFLPGSLSLSLPRCLLLPSYFLYPVSARIYRDILRYPSSVSLFLSIFFSHTAPHTLRP